MTDQSQQRKFKLMADYECWPVWETTGGEFCNLDPQLLGLSDALVNRIEAWADLYDATLQSDDPAASDFTNETDRLSFEHEGLTIWWAMQLALPDAEISYFSELFQRLYTPQ